MCIKLQTFLNIDYIKYFVFIVINENKKIEKNVII
jgi:hypothetical protein